MERDSEPPLYQLWMWENTVSSPSEVWGGAPAAQWFPVSYLEFNVPFQHKYGYIRDERSQFIEDTVEPSVFLPGIISLAIMCIGII